MDRSLHHTDHKACLHLYYSQPSARHLQWWSRCILEDITEQSIKWQDKIHDWDPKLFTFMSPLLSRRKNVSSPCWYAWMVLHIDAKCHKWLPLSELKASSPGAFMPNIWAWQVCLEAYSEETTSSPSALLSWSSHSFSLSLTGGLISLPFSIFQYVWALFVLQA